MMIREHRSGFAWKLVVVLAAAVALLAAVALEARAGGEQERPRVVFVTFDCAEGNFLCPGFKAALRRTGVSGRLVSPDFREDPVATLSLLARGGYDLVIADFDWPETVGIVAPNFPKTRFAVFDVPLNEVPGPPANAQGVVHRPHEAAYLAGWLAARMEQRRPGKDVVGTVGGAPIPAVDDFIVGFEAGARRAAPGITVLRDYSEDFADAVKCDAIARSQIARGAGVVFNVAGGCGLGTLRAAKRAGVWAVGVDTDQSFLGPHILTSVIKRYDAGFLALFRPLVAGNPRTGGTTVLTLRNGGSGLGRISPRVPASLRAEIDRLRRRIVAGEIRVPGAER